MRARSPTTHRRMDLAPAACGGQHHSRLWQRGMGTGGARVRAEVSRWWSCRLPVPPPTTARARILFHPHPRRFSFCLCWVPGWLDRSSSLLALVMAWALRDRVA
jgi:hypothetical protein